MRREITSATRRFRGFSLVLTALTFGLLGDNCNDPPLPPVAGVPEYQQALVVPVPGGEVNVAGGNLLLRRTDLSIDTRLGTYDLVGTYNSATGRWAFDFEMTCLNSLLVDATGATHSLDGLAVGQAIPGTYWVKMGSAAVKTKGGWLHRFAADGRLTSIERVDGVYPRLVYVGGTVAGKTRTVEIEQCDAANDCTTFFDVGYDSSGRVTSVTDRAGRTATYAYEAASGRLLTARNGLDTAKGYPGTRYEYDTAGFLSAQISSAGNRIEYVHGGGRLTRATSIGVENPTHRFAYYGKGGDSFWETDVFSPSNAKTVYAYDALRRIASLRNAQTGDVTTWTWGSRRPSSMTLPGNVTTSWTYTNDDVSTANLPSGNVVTYTYQASAVNSGDSWATPIASIVDSVGLVEQRSYVGGRVTSVSNGEGEATTFTYTALGHLNKVTTPSGVVTDYNDYGKHGHARASVRGELAMAYVYDTVGNLLEGPGGDGPSAPGLGGIVSRKFDEMRNVVEVTLANLDANAAVTATRKLTVERRPDGAMTAVRRPYGGDWEFSYDALGRVVERRERVGGTWRATTFTFDAYDRRRSIQAPNGMRTEWTYDGSDRVATTRILEDGVLQASESRSYANARLAALSDTSYPASESYTYDAAGRISSVDYPRGERKTFGYDLRSRLVAEVYYDDDDLVITSILRTYDLADRSRRVMEGFFPLLEHEHEDGMRSLTRYGNGLERRYDYDGTLGMLSGSTTVNGAGQHVEDTSVDWSIGLFSVDASTQTRGGLNVTKTELYYFGPFLGAQTPGVRISRWSKDGGTNLREFEYDELNNVRTVNDGGRVFHYNAERNRLNSITGGSPHVYAYDEAGYVTSRDGVTIDWDAAGRIKSIGSSASFVWDVQGRRMLRSLPGLAHVYLFGGEMKANILLQPISLDLGEVEIRFQPQSHYYRHTDFRGNVKFVTDDDGAVVTHYRYDPYGLDFVAGLEAVEGEFAQGFAVAGLVVLGSRAYDPDAARFLAPDPVPQLVNQHVYTMANPVLFWDPGGLEAAQAGPYESSFSQFGDQWGGAFGATFGTILGAGLDALEGSPPSTYTAIGAVVGGVAGEGLGSFLAGGVGKLLDTINEGLGDAMTGAVGPSTGGQTSLDGGRSSSSSSSGSSGGGSSGGPGVSGPASGSGGGGHGPSAGGAGSPGGHPSDGSFGGDFGSWGEALAGTGLSGAFGIPCSPVQYTTLASVGRTLAILIPVGVLLGWRARLHLRREAQRDGVS